MSQTALISNTLICSVRKWKEGERVRNGAVESEWYWWAVCDWSVCLFFTLMSQTLLCEWFHLDQIKAVSDG